MTLTHARFFAYIIGALLGAVLAVIGAVRGDAGLVTAGIGLVGVGGLAAPNTPLKTPEGDHADTGS